MYSENTDLECLVVGEEGLCLIIADAWVNNHVFTLLPVYRGGDAVLVANLKRVDDTQDFVKVAAGLGGVADSQPDDFLGVDDENGADLPSIQNYA